MKAKHFGMNARIGTTAAAYIGSRKAEYLTECVLNGRLNGDAVRLNLPSAVRRAVIFNYHKPSRHK